MSETLYVYYDRHVEAGQWNRLHQEDFCQALGIDASRKYEKEGGPSLKQCAQVIREHVAMPLVVEDYRQQFGESPVLERLPIVIRKLVRRVSSQLK